jgi:hypothetical protein
MWIYRAQHHRMAARTPLNDETLTSDQYPPTPVLIRAKGSPFNQTLLDALNIPDNGLKASESMGFAAVG